MILHLVILTIIYNNILIFYYKFIIFYLHYYFYQNIKLFTTSYAENKNKQILVTISA
jgi:hypothetical protein